MKDKLFIMLLLLVFVGTPVYADESSSYFSKLGKGIMGILKSPKELYEQPKKAIEEEDNNFVGMAKGLLKAPFGFVKKLGKGLVDVITFPAEEDESLISEDTLNKAKNALKEIMKAPKALVSTVKDEVEMGDNTFLDSIKGLVKTPFEFIEKLGDGVFDFIGSPSKE